MNTLSHSIASFTLCIVLVLFSSCSKKEQPPLENHKESLTAVDLSTIDSDGDLINDKLEINRGTNPHIADIPNLRVRFLQNYKIKVDYGDKDSPYEFVLDTAHGRAQADFKYRVGNIFARHSAFKEASRVGRFNTHHAGKFSDQDLSWVKYPDIDKRFFLSQKDRFYQNIKDQKILGAALELENSVRLQENESFNSIKNLVLQFRYYDHEKESYESIGKLTINRHFSAGVNESFSVTLKDIPHSLILNNYFSRGEFIISEVVDFEIPSLKTTYKKLLGSVKAKTVPIVFNTPLRSETFYASLGRRGSRSLHDLLGILFKKEFRVEDNTLSKVLQFENNLGDYDYLAELKKEDKKGKWFVFTNQLNRHYLDYSFTSSDKIALSYITGSQLSHQESEVISVQEETLTGGDYERFLPLGNVSPNSEITLLINPLKKWGKRVHEEHSNYHQGQHSCGQNRICGGLDRICHQIRYDYSDYDEVLRLDRSIDAELSDSLSLIINDTEYSFSDLIGAKKAVLKWKNNKLFITIPNVNEIIKLSSAEENLIGVKVKTKVLSSHQGFRLVSAGGQFPQECAIDTLRFAIQAGKRPISLASQYANELRPLATQNGVSILPKLEFRQHFSYGIQSIVKNFFN